MYWRMQVLPGDSYNAIKHTVESISAGYIGLDFVTDVPDLKTIQQDTLPESQRNYWAFAREMQIGDHAPLFAHHFPLALVAWRESTTTSEKKPPRSASGSVTFARSIMSAITGITLPTQGNGNISP